jgi:hypothetical protein
MLKSGPKPSPVAARYRNKRLGGGSGGGDDRGGVSGDDDNDEEEEGEEDEGGGGGGKVSRVDPLRALLLHPSARAYTRPLFSST